MFNNGPLDGVALTPVTYLGSQTRVFMVDRKARPIRSDSRDVTLGRFNLVDVALSDTRCFFFGLVINSKSPCGSMAPSAFITL